MPIAVTCPKCATRYPNIPDSFAGKTAQCKKPECREKFLIPAAATVPPSASASASAAPAPPAAKPNPPAAKPAERKPSGKPAANGTADRQTVPISRNDTPPPAPPIDADAAALAALADEPVKKDEVDPSTRTIAVKCDGCDHQWTVPFAMAGKNALCPECRRRVKVPEPKEDVPQDWRQKKTALPSMAKQNFEKLEGVQSAGDAKIVSGQALREADATGIEIEPRPLKQKVFFAVTAVALVVGLVVGIVYISRTTTTGKEDRLMEDALQEYAKAEERPTDAPLHSAILHIAAAEHALRHDDEKKLKEALDHIAKARDDVNKATPSPARNAVAGELALAVLALGGNPEQIAAQIRYKWTPEAPGNRQLRVNEKVISVHTELGRALTLLQPADFDTKAIFARRLARELVRRGQPDLAADLPNLFTEAEKPEGRAVIALELYRADRGSAVARRVAEELKVQLAGGGATGKAPFPASAVTLWEVVGTEKPPAIVSKPGATGDVNDATRIAHTGILLLQDKPDDALKLASRPGAPISAPGRFRAIGLCAEWSADPGPAFDAADALLKGDGRKKEVTIPAGVLLRLTQLAATAGKHDRADLFAKAIPDDGLKAWAQGDAVRSRVGPAVKEAAEETWIEAPDDPKKLRAGHAWGRFWVARHNAMLSGSRDDVKKYAQWPKGTIHPFALAGVAVGLQDRE